MEDMLGYHWSVSYQHKETLAKEKASSALNDLFAGDYCTYPEGYDNFGEAPFSSGDSDEESQSALEQLKKYALLILDKACYAAHSSWEGDCHNVGDPSSQIERQDFFFSALRMIKSFS